MSKYEELKNKIISRVKDKTVEVEHKGVHFNIKVEDDILVIDVKNDLKHKIRTISFGKLNNTFVTENGEVNTVTLKGNKEHTDSSVEVLIMIECLTK